MFYGIFDSPGWQYPGVNTSRRMARLVGFWYDGKTPMQDTFKIITNIWTITLTVSALNNQTIELFLATHEIKRFADGYISWLMCFLTTLHWSYFTFKGKKQLFRQLLQDAEKIFIKSIIPPEQKAIAIKFDNQCRKLLILYAFNVNVVCVCYWSIAILANRAGNGYAHVLPFRFHIPFVDFGKSPEFEMAFFVLLCMIYTIGVTTICFHSIIFNLISMAAAQLSIVALRFQNFTDEYMERIETNNYIDEEAEIQAVCSELTNIIRRHQFLIQYVSRLDNLLSVILLVNLGSGNTGLCFAFYRTLISEEPVEIVLNFSISFVVATQILTMCYICNAIIDESTAVFSSVYASYWYCLPQNELGKRIKKNVLPIIVRGQAPLALTTAGFTNMSVNCFANMITTTLSYLAVLRKDE